MKTREQLVEEISEYTKEHVRLTEEFLKLHRKGYAFREQRKDIITERCIVGSKRHWASKALKQLDEGSK